MKTKNQLPLQPALFIDLLLLFVIENAHVSGDIGYPRDLTYFVVFQIYYLIIVLLSCFSDPPEAGV